MAHWLALTCAIWRFVASCKASGMLVAPERRISSPVMTWMAEGAEESFSGSRETVVTSRFIN